MRCCDTGNRGTGRWTIPQISACGSSRMMRLVNLEARFGLAFDKRRTRKLFIFDSYHQMADPAPRVDVKAVLKRPTYTPLLIGVLVSVSREEREKDDAQVKKEIPILQIVQVMLDAPTDRSITPPAIYLSPTRYPNFQPVAVIVACDFT